MTARELAEILLKTPDAEVWIGREHSRHAAVVTTGFEGERNGSRVFYSKTYPGYHREPCVQAVAIQEDY